ncbi:hypothetical protein D2E26_0362 [Bifidobacterium dolichotidis]|uniref:SPOR domain-containing protein n=1 Tax=Bifidobacterium dolichotidis TaxID=2306976 RepID=A0A430FSG3_9BIFI|nr:hypothetical protein [Bifidobacterium dolichotidis]RSX55799.1 hypothetical protein D2E26_0362 [Bifidobacterium dolichotidis]
MSDPMKQEWYYNTKTGKVELGPQSPLEYRMGPYASQEEAEKALEIAAERNKHWDNQDKAWNSWGTSMHD